MLQSVRQTLSGGYCHLKVQVVVHCSSDPIDLQSHKLVRGHANSPYIQQGSDTIFSTFDYATSNTL